MSSVSPLREEEVRAKLEIRVFVEEFFKAECLTFLGFEELFEINISRTNHVFQVGCHLILGLWIGD